VASGQRFGELLRLLARHRVDFVVVGAAAAVLEGAPLTTFDLDVVIDPRSANRSRLLGALDEVEAVYYDPAGREIRPTKERLESNRTNLFETRLGRLDVMRKIGREAGWEDLLPRSHAVALGELVIRVLDLEAVIETKEAAGRDKDRAALPLLRETLRLKQERDRDRR
jgi:hypothetical protein